MRKGDKLIYIGMIKSTKATPEFMFNYLNIYGEYKIIGECKFNDGGLYYLINYGHGSLWYPEENFKTKIDKKMFSETYNLR